MRKIWVSAIVVAAILVVAIVLVGSARQQKVPEPSAASAFVPNTGIPAKKLARKTQKSEDCTPVAGGGFSCGACRQDMDCPEKSACVVNLATGKTECQAPDCSKNQQCEKGTFCRVVARTPSGVAVQACVAPGQRPAGAACDPDNGADPTVSCAGNMVCIEGGCAPPCEPTPIPKDSEECGYLGCIGTDNGYGCTPSCKQGQPCGGGKTCSFLSTEGPISLCTHVVGKNCLGPEGGCTASQECLVETNAREERTTFRCAERCTLENADTTCPENSICVLRRQQGKPGGLCRKPCAQEGDPVCGSDERCKTDDTGIWFCSAT
jgi:hypothetical protein